MHLLRLLADTGGGRLLDLNNPGHNPFQHNRVKTRQPRDLWEWLLGVGIILFVFDVGLRRIQLEREEMAKAWAAVRRVVVFWNPPPKVQKTDESLAALLSRRDQVRERQRRPETAREDLFQPAQPVSMPMPGAVVGEEAPAAAAAPEPESAPPPPAEPESATSRLLAAKKRAQQRRK